MDTFLTFALTGVVLFSLGLQEVLARPGVLRMLIAVNVMGSGTLLFFVSLAHRHADGPDPVPHALALTGIVVTLAATAAGLALARGLHRLRAEGSGSRAEGGRVEDSRAEGGRAEGGRSQGAGYERGRSESGRDEQGRADR